MKEKKKVIAIVLIILCLLLISIFLVYSLNNNKKEEDKKFPEENTHISSYYLNTSKNNVVTNRDDFFTAQSCVQKYILYITQKDKESIYKLLDKSYIDQFKVTKDNVLEHVENLSGEITFKAKKMYFDKVNENFYKYYVIGEILEEKMDENPKSMGEFKVTVNMDLENMLFSIVPYGYGGTFHEKE